MLLGLFQWNLVSILPQIQFGHCKLHFLLALLREWLDYFEISFNFLVPLHVLAHRGDELLFDTKDHTPQ